MVGTLSKRMKNHMRLVQEKSTGMVPRRPTPENLSLTEKKVASSTSSAASTNKTLSTRSSCYSMLMNKYSRNGNRMTSGSKTARDSRDEVSETRHTDTSTCCDLCRQSQGRDDTSLSRKQVAVSRRREVMGRITAAKGKSVTFCCANPPGYEEPLVITQERQNIINKRYLSKQREALIAERKAAQAERNKKELRESILAERQAKFVGKGKKSSDKK